MMLSAGSTLKQHNDVLPVTKGLIMICMVKTELSICNLLHITLYVVTRSNILRQFENGS